MKEYATSGFPNNENGNLFMQVNCNFIGKIDKKPIVPHTSEKLNETIRKAVEEGINNRMRCFGTIRNI